MVDRAGFEPATSRMPSGRSDRIDLNFRCSYRADLPAHRSDSFHSMPKKVLLTLLSRDFFDPKIVSCGPAIRRLIVSRACLVVLSNP